VRALRDTLERERSESKRRVTELERRVEEAGSEHQREHEHRKGLEERLGTELGALEEARRTIQSQTAAAAERDQRLEGLERRREDLEAALREVRGDRAREREQRQRLEQRVEALIEMEADARKTRGEQASSLASRRSEAERAAEEAQRALRDARRELERERERSGRRAGARIESDRRPAEVGSADPAPRAEETLDGDAVQGERSEPVVAGREEAARPAAPRDRGGGIFGRWRRHAPGNCSVCRRLRPPMTGSELAESGWIVTEEAGVCPGCRQEGWGLPPGTTLPLRRLDGQRSD
jgi:hypothetical protein